MGYKRALIYFASGTGNSYRLAVWFQELCRERGISAEVIPASLAAPREEIEASPDTLVALVFPAHGLLPPWSVIKFLFRLPVRSRTHCIVLPTRGCFHIGPVPIPGAAGLGSFLPWFLLPFKGYRIRGSLSFDMPLNMTSFHPRLTDGGIRRIINRARARAWHRLAPVLEGKTLFFTLNNLWEALWGFIPLALFPLFPAAYLLIGRFFMGKMMFASSDCVSCGLCAASCPVGAIVMKGDENPRPYWRYNCEDCLRCLNFCPHRAVEAGHSWAALLVLISSVSVSALVFDLLAVQWPPLAAIRSPLLLEVLNAVYYYPAVLIAYFLFFHALRFRPVNRFFTLTTLTHYFRRYREPQTRLADMLRKRQ